jgi:hypothetical protein
MRLPQAVAVRLYSITNAAYSLPITDFHPFIQQYTHVVFELPDTGLFINVQIFKPAWKK